MISRAASCARNAVAYANVVDARDMPARMVVPGPVGFHERQQVMIAAVRAVHESDELAGLIRQAQSQGLAIESHRTRHVRAEEEHMREAARTNPAGSRAARRCVRRLRRSKRGDRRDRTAALEAARDVLSRQVSER